MKLAAIIALVSIPGTALAQSEAQVWSSASLEGDLSDSVELGVEQHLRFDDNSSRFGSVLTDLGLSYEAIDWLRLGAGYRFGYQRDGSGDLVIRHRFHGQGEFRLEPAEPVRLSLRTRWQEQVRDSGLRHKLRNRFEVGWKATKDLTPSASVEIFHRVGGGDGVVFETLRLTLGAGYEIGKRNEVGAFYRYEQPQDEPLDPTLHILGLEYGYTL